MKRIMTLGIALCSFFIHVSEGQVSRNIAAKQWLRLNDANFQKQLDGMAVEQLKEAFVVIADATAHITDHAVSNDNRIKNHRVELTQIEQLQINRLNLVYSRLAGCVTYMPYMYQSEELLPASDRKRTRS